MPMSQNVRADDDVTDYNGYLLGQTKGGRWRVYEDATSYNSRSGQIMMKGPVMRDVDDSIFTFNTQAVAEAWIDDGCKVSML